MHVSGVMQAPSFPAHGASWQPAPSLHGAPGPAVPPHILYALAARTAGPVHQLTAVSLYITWVLLSSSQKGPKPQVQSKL